MDFILLIIIAIVFILGLLIVVNVKTKKAKREFLKEYGAKIQAKTKYISAEVNFFPVPSNYPTDLVSFKIVCESADPVSKKLKEYISDSMSLKPNIKISETYFLDIYVNMQNADYYWVDISKVPVKNYSPHDFERYWNAITVRYRSYDGITYKLVEKNA